MKLNNHGWGLKEMLFLSAILFFFVILVSVLISNLYKGLDRTTIISPDETSSQTKEYTYSQIESNLKQAAQRYYQKNKEEIGDIIISSELIENGYITKSKLKTKDDDCEGYVIIGDDFATFITCDQYETEGY